MFEDYRWMKSGVGMISSEGDEFSFITPTACEGPVEVWMLNIEQEMH